MYAKRSLMLRRSSSYSFFALTSTRSRTPTLPKSWSTPAYSSCCRCVGVKCTLGQRPVGHARRPSSPAPRTCVATRREWPEVVGSRDSIAVTDASTKPVEHARGSRRRGARSPARCPPSPPTPARAPRSAGRRPTTSRVGVSSGRARVAALVDQLHDADHLAVRGQHRHRQHRPRAVAGLLVEAAVVAQRLRLRVRAPAATGRGC